MMRSGQQGGKRMVAFLGAVVAGLALLNWHIASAPVDIAPVAPEAGRLDAPRNPDSALLTTFDKRPVSQFREIVNRPLFVPDRRPVQRHQPPTNEHAGLGAMRLIGVMKLDNQPGRALIRMASGGPGKWIAEGEQFDGWKLRQVTTRSVIVEAGGRSHELALQSIPGPREEQPDPGEEPTPAPKR